MGSDFLSNKQFQTTIEENPELISWSSLREVVLHRGKSGQLGFKVHTFKGPDQTYTIVTKVKEDCQEWQGKLRVYDRIICINGNDISRDDGSRVLKLLKGSSGPYVKFFVCQPDRIRIISSRTSLQGSESWSYTFGTLNVPSLGNSSEKIFHSADSRETLVSVLSESTALKANNDLTNDVNCKTDKSNNKQEQQKDSLVSDSKDNKSFLKSVAVGPECQENDKLNDLSRIGKNILTEAFETSNFSVVPNITSVNSQFSRTTCSTNISSEYHVNSQSSRTTCSSNPSSDYGSFPSREGSYNKVTSDSSCDANSNSELIDHIIRASDNFHDCKRVNGEFSSSGFKLNKNSGGNLSSSLKSQNDLKSNCSQVSRLSGRSPSSMGKSKGDKIVRKFYKGNSQDSNDGAEELEPLRPWENTQHHGKGKYTHVYDEDRALSVPLTCKDVALSVQDIQFDESSQTVPFITEPSYINNCPCATCVVTSGICQSCGNKPGSNLRRSPSHMVSMVPETSEGLLPENYGPFLLKNPHLALWDGAKTRVVEIDRGSSNEFPFSYKVKIGKNQDASVEIYTLVESLVQGGPACGKLNIGDWIRSVNGTPIQLPMDAFSLLSNNNKDTYLRLVIQRPVGFSQQPGSSSSPPCPRTDKGDKSPQDLSPKSPHELTPTSPLPSPLLSIASRELREPLLADSHLPGRIETKKSTGHLDKKEPRKIYIQNINKDESEMDSWNTPFPRVVKLPKVRMFVCGSEAERCASLILQGSEISCDNIHQGYAYIDCSMATNSFGSIVISPSCSNLYATSLSLSNMTVSSMSQSEISSGEKVGMKCRHCGNEFHCSASHSFAGTVANVELFVISDEKFFHNCCTYLFTKYSIFILTFDGAKLLRSAPVEISRMQNLSHTIRSFAGYDCHIMSCGLLDGGGESKHIADEVRTLFYTSSVSKLQIFNVLGPPELIHVDYTSASSDTLSSGRQLQSSIWKIVTETIQRQHILQPCLILMDHLNSVRDHELILTESQMMEIVRKRLPQYQQDVHQMVVTEMSMCGEIVFGKAAPVTFPHLQKVENLVLIDPKVMAARLHSAISAIADDKQRWARVHSLDLIDIQDFVKLCVGDSGNRYLVDFMESYGLIFRHFPVQPQQVEYFLPYFAVVAASSENVTVDKKDHVLYLQFNKSHGSTQLFFRLLLNIASHTDSPKSFDIHTVNCCNFKHRGLICTAVHQKLEDRIMFLFKREDKSKSLNLPDLYTWLLSVCQRTQDIQFLLGAPCPLGENCHTSSAPGIHIIDLTENKTHYCGDEKIDLMKPLRAWRPKSQEVEKSASVQRKPVLILNLNYSTFDRICLKLKVQSPFGRDWKGLAGLMGKTAEDVALYETTNNPPQALLREWSQSGKGTVEELIRLLGELEREDIVSEIRAAVTSSPVVTITPPLPARAEADYLPPNIL